MVMGLTLATLGSSLLASKRPSPRRHRRSDSKESAPADLLRRVARGGPVMDDRVVIRFGLRDANEPDEPEEIRRRTA